MALNSLSRNSCVVLVIGVAAMFAGAIAFAARPAISQDRELKEVDLKTWDCADEGTAKTPDGAERNRLKNRPPASVAGVNLKAMDTASFLRFIGGFDAKTRSSRRKDLSAELLGELNPLDKQIVSFEGYLVLAYAGPPESTNCGSTDFHDWHLELFEKPLDHAPGIGDVTPIVCEITPRTEGALFRENVRMQDLAAFIRAPDLTIEPTGHPARKIRVTGYLLWDDEHNGTADVGSEIRTFTANKYHQPWRSTAWEIHPALKIEAVDRPSNSPPAPAPSPTPPTQTPTAAPAAPAAANTVPAVAPSASTLKQFVTLTHAVTLKIPYGETVLPSGTKLPVVARDAATVTIRYLENTYKIPITSTDAR